MNNPLHILHLEDDADDAALTLATLEAGGIVCSSTRVETHDAFLAALELGGIDLILLDYSMPQFDGLSAAELVREKWASIPLIFVSGILGEELAIESLKRGATDYVLKQRLGRLVPAVERAMREVEQRMERSRLEAQFVEAQKMEVIGQLAGGIAHDFNNILSAIMGYAGMTRMEISDNAKASDYVRQIEAAGHRASELVTQILGFSRRQAQERKATQLKHIAGEALKLLRATVPSTIKFVYNLKTTPPVLANPTAVHQLVMNLCTNAWHSMRNRPGTISVILESVEVDRSFAAAHPELQPGSYVRFSVADTGCGMDSQTLQQIFTPFFTTKAEGEGTGLGLAAVHAIMKNHDGCVTVESEAGVGSTFSLFFPAYKSEVAETCHQLAPVPRGHGERILLLDDELLLGQLGQTILEQLGYVVTVQSKPFEASALFCREPAQFDLVVTDLTMPGMDGVRFAMQLWQHTPSFPIILTSGYSEVMTQERVLELGFRDLLLKPVTIRAVGEAVHRALHPVEEAALVN